jgi:hypothetical protein
MKWIFLTLFSLTPLFSVAENSKVIPAFLEASEIYQSEAGDSLTLRPEIRAIVDVFKNHQIGPELLENFYPEKNDWPLPEDDKYDLWIKKSQEKLSFSEETPPIAFQAVKLDVIKASQMTDDIYAYFFVTDGVMPTGKVTSIYKGVSSGESFFFNPLDRAIFPLIGVPSKSPNHHLIIDYGIIESDGDDITKLQKLSSIIIDIAIAVYSSQSPSNGAMIANLRKEIKALADLVIAQNYDDRLVTHSIGFSTQDLNKMIEGKTFHEFKQNHKYDSSFFGWEYDLHFRILK